MKIALLHIALWMLRLQLTLVKNLFKIEKKKERVTRDTNQRDEGKRRGRCGNINGARHMNVYHVFISGT